MKIAVLISGGVDSAVTVDRLYRQGHDLHLFYIRISMDNGEGECTAEEDIEMCTLIAKKYNLPFKVVSLHEEYWEYVMEYALRTVKEGLTPHPDMMCNKIIKFGFFEDRWGKEYDKTATGHYAKVIEKNGKYWLATAPDPVKDQTDFLAQISYDQLSHIIFPLGDMTKEEVREAAREADLPNATRKDSQGICFLGKIDYSEFLERKLGTKKGPVIEIETGKKIGEHKGYWFYTIGQRKGLGLGGGPWFVVKKNIRDNVIYVSHGYDTKLQYGKVIGMAELDWITVNPFECKDFWKDSEANLKISFKTRHTPEFLDGKLRKTEDQGYLLESDTEVQGIAPGQYCIIYTPDRKICLGSGMIVNDSKNKRNGK
ncbi:MAG: tRNA 2-thiouridine(34) synthase MnmA [Muribaculaceae bacterium]|nr:tRNA 2-thiouridine(34) synthase MnmA [Muribaculaceae bacterium]